MKKLLIGLGVLTGVGLVVAKVLAPRCAQGDWKKRLESMPDNSRPKWMFTSIEAIRANTDRILELLEARPSEAGDADVASQTAAGG